MPESLCTSACIGSIIGRHAATLNLSPCILLPCVCGGVGGWEGGCVGVGGWVWVCVGGGGDSPVYAS